MKRKAGVVGDVAGGVVGVGGGWVVGGWVVGALWGRCGGRVLVGAGGGGVQLGRDKGAGDLGGFVGKYRLQSAMCPFQNRLGFMQQRVPEGASPSVVRQKDRILSYTVFKALQIPLNPCIDATVLRKFFLAVAANETDKDAPATICAQPEVTAHMQQPDMQAHGAAFFDHKFQALTSGPSPKPEASKPGTPNPLPEPYILAELLPT